MIFDLQRFGTPQDVIKDFMTVLDTTKISYDEDDSASMLTAGEILLNKAVKLASNSKYTTIQGLIDKIVSDCQTYNNKDSANGWKKFLADKCGINLDNTDTGAISGYDAGGSSKIKTAASIVPETGSKKSCTTTSFKVTDGSKNYGLTIQLANNTLTATTRHIWDCLYTWWGKGALKLIEESFGYSFADLEEKINNLTLSFVSSANYLAATGLTVNSKSIKMTINLQHYSKFSSNDYDGTSTTGNAYLDRIIAHEMTHAAMMAKVYNHWCLPQFITEGTADLLCGIDDTFKGILMRALAKDPYALKNSLNLSSGTGDAFTYAAGVIFLRYFAKQASDSANVSGSFEISDSIPSGISVKNKILTVSSKFAGDFVDLSEFSSSTTKINASAVTKSFNIFGNAAANSIKGGTGKDQIFGGVGKDTIYGGANSDFLSGGTGNDRLFGEAGNDTLSGGEGNDTLEGGAGNDIFIYGSGNDVISDYASGDKIRLSSTTISSVKVSGSDVILSVGGNTLTVKGAKGKNITVIDKDNKSTTKKYSSSTDNPSGTLKLTNSTKSPVTIDSAVKTVDASARTIAVEITGNAIANTISGGSKNDTIYGGAGKDSLVGNAGRDKLYGEAGNDILIGGAGKDSLWGGKGNDSLWGGADNDSLWGDAGNDKFIYAAGDGKDVIFGFEDNDLLQINGAETFSATYNKSTKTIAFKVDDYANAITLKDFTATSFKVNGDTYKISGSKLVKK